MERSRVTIITLICISLFSLKKISGAEMEMKVRPGDNITIYCDRSLHYGYEMLWIRNCSHENQPSLIIDISVMEQKSFQRFSFKDNRENNSYDLHISNISVSDLGLYYCVVVERRVNKNKNGIISSSEIFHYGNQITRLSFTDPVCPCADPSSTTSPPPVSDCVLCWTLLFSVCPVCVLLSSLLSSTCVYCLCQKKTTDAGDDLNEKMKHRNVEDEEDEVCYASLDVMTRRQKQLKKKSIQSSDFSTYAAVKTEAV